MHVRGEKTLFQAFYRNIAVYKCYISDTDSLYSCVYKHTYRIRAYRQMYKYKYTLIRVYRLRIQITTVAIYT